MHFLNPRKFVTHIINVIIIDRNYYSLLNISAQPRETLSAQCSFSSIPPDHSTPPPSTIHNNSSTSAAIHTILKELYNNNNWQYPQQQQQFTRVQPPLSQSQLRHSLPDYVTQSDTTRTATTNKWWTLFRYTLLLT